MGLRGIFAAALPSPLAPFRVPAAGPAGSVGRTTGARDRPPSFLMANVGAVRQAPGI